MYKLFTSLGRSKMFEKDKDISISDFNYYYFCFAVLNDITSIMLNEKFLDELFKPQKIYNKDALKNLFHDLAHASIMRLNEASMSKLYDLMTMVFKYQVGV